MSKPKPLRGQCQYCNHPPFKTNRERAGHEAQHMTGRKGENLKGTIEAGKMKEAQLQAEAAMLDGHMVEEAAPPAYQKSVVSPPVQPQAQIQVGDEFEPPAHILNQIMNPADRERMRQNWRAQKMAEYAQSQQNQTQAQQAAQEEMMRQSAQNGPQMGAPGRTLALNDPNTPPPPPQGTDWGALLSRGMDMLQKFRDDRRRATAGPDPFAEIGRESYQIFLGNLSKERGRAMGKRLLKEEDNDEDDAETRISRVVAKQLGKFMEKRQPYYPPEEEGGAPEPAQAAEPLDQMAEQFAGHEEETEHE